MSLPRSESRPFPVRSSDLKDVDLSEKFEINEHGVPQYPKGDARRLFVVLAAIDSLERPTITTVAAYTGHNKGTVDADVAKLREQYGVEIERDGAVFVLRSWGEVLKRVGVKKYLRG
jgi:hypothetical protein